MKTTNRAVQCPRWLSTLWEALDTPVSLKMILLWRAGEWDQIAQASIDPHQYDDSIWGYQRFARDLQAVDVLRKCRDLNTSFNRDEVALESFHQAEKQCHVSNARLKRIWADMQDGYCSDPQMARIQDFVGACRKHVRRILGPVPDRLDLARFGPGATFESKGFDCVDVTIGDKITNNFAHTSESHAVVRHTLDGTALDRYANQVSRLTQVRGNRFTTVPKNAKTSRGICIEPGANVYCQLGVGGHIRSRLKRVGIDLDHGQHLHARLAQEGSARDLWCTIDLQSASDTVCKELVKLLLPESWYLLLNSLRSPLTQVKGKWHALEKFSSMGNGFTFELETLIFGVIAAEASQGVLGHNVFVYGDDIIVPNDSYRDVVAALRFFGFTPNASKSYATSPFRESCGGQFFAGLRVTTCKLEEFPNSVPEWFSFHNGLASFDFLLTRKARLRVRDELPSHVRGIRGPSRLGDQVIWDLDRTTWARKRHEGYDTDLIRVIVPQVSKVELHHFGPDVLHVLALYNLRNEPLSTRRVIGFKVKWRVPHGITTE